MRTLDSRKFLAEYARLCRKFHLVVGSEDYVALFRATDKQVAENVRELRTDWQKLAKKVCRQMFLASVGFQLSDKHRITKKNLEAFKRLGKIATKYKE